MDGMEWQDWLMQNWHVKLVCLLLIVAAYIDGKQLRVPNWLTYPMVFSGLVFNAWMGGWTGLGDGLVGMVVGLACLLPLYRVGGLGATVTFYAFCVSTVVGAVMAIAMVMYRKAAVKHYAQLLTILHEWMT